MSDNESKKEVSREALDKLIRHHMIAAFGAGMVPLPMVDFMAISGVQFNLVRKLAMAYDVPFSRNAVKSIVSSLAGGAVPTVVGPAIKSLARTVPLVGFPLSAVSISVTAAAMTYAVGNVFIRHFDSNGTLLNFEIDAVREYFGEMYQKGESLASSLKANMFKTKRKTASGEEGQAGPTNVKGPSEAPAEGAEKNGGSSKKASRGEKTSAPPKRPSRGAKRGEKTSKAPKKASKK
jgi:uncharacterized protein (DUF697 family)